MTTKQLKDPLKTYTTGSHSYDPVVANNQSTIKAFVPKSEYEDLFKKTTQIKNFLNEEKAPYLEKIYNDAKYITDHFKPLYDLGLKNLVIDVTGGAARDFVLNKHQEIKDLDIMISYNIFNGKIETISENENALKNITKEKLLAHGFTENELNNVNFQDISLLDKKEQNEQTHEKFIEDIEEESSKYIDHLNSLINLCANRIKGTKEKFFKTNKEICLEERENRKENNEVDYVENLRDRLSGVIKIESDNLNYGVDLLITNHSKLNFLQNFDINLCKASFSLINLEYNNKFPSNFSHLTSRFSSCLEFFGDVYNKKITVVVDDVAYKRLEACVKHIKRMQVKYPDYQLNIVSANNEKDNPQRVIFLEKALLKNTIEETINTTNEQKKPRGKI